MNGREVAELYGIEDGVPNMRMALAVWRLLAIHGKNLPEDDQPEPPRGDWQIDALGNMLYNPYSSLQGCRQATGKSFIAALVVTCFLMLGARGFIAMPSLKQGSRILMRRTHNFTSVLFPLVGINKVSKGNSQEILWDNGAGLMALSSNVVATVGTQGYTGRFGVIDEAHDLQYTALGYFTPVTSLAMKRKRGRLMLIGVGGTKDSASEMVKTDPLYSDIMLDDRRIIADDNKQRAKWAAELKRCDDPRRIKRLTQRLDENSWQTEFGMYERTMDPPLYDQFYRCLPVRAGTRTLFPDLQAALKFAKDVDLQNYFTIDVGKIKDTTRVAWWHVQGEMNLMKETLTLYGEDYPEQAVEVARWILSRPGLKPRENFEPGDVIVETNGPGEGFADCLAKIYPFNALLRICTSNVVGSFLKDTWIKTMRGKAYDGGPDDPVQFAVERNRERRELGDLEYEIDEQGKYHWPHNDLLSCVWLLEARNSRALAV